jgi:methyltransferase
MATALFVVLVGGLIVERLLEVRAGNRNMKRLLADGAREHSGGHYPVIVTMHTLFFISLISEWMARGKPLATYWYIPFTLLLAAQILRWLSRRALAGRWTTRIVTLPGKPLVANGPYKYMPHPIYIAVCLELSSLPMIFGLWYTALIFTVLNAIMLLGFRIPAENRALSEV